MATISKRIKLDFIVTQTLVEEEEEGEFSNEEIAANFKKFLKEELDRSILVFNEAEVTDEG